MHSVLHEWTILAYQKQLLKIDGSYRLCHLWITLKVTRPSYFVAVQSYFETLWYPHLYFNSKSNI